MTAEISLKLYNLSFEFIKDKVKAQEFVSKLEETIDNKFEEKSKILATKQDLYEIKSDLLKSIYIIGLIQFLAIVGSVLAIVNFMLK